MSKKLTSNQFISKAIKKHGEVYDYTNSLYKTTRDYVEIRCKKHGVFIQKANTHLQGSGCPKCVHKKSNTKEFVKKAKKVHGNKYDYSSSGL